LPLGHVLISAGLLSDVQLRLALARQQETGRPLGHVLTSMGFVSAAAMANALAEQHGEPFESEYGVGMGLTERAQPPLAALEPEPIDPDPLVLSLQTTQSELLRERDALRSEVVSLEGKIDALEERLNQALRERDEARAAREEATASDDASPSVDSSAHLLFVPTAEDYALVERDGPPPGAGEAVEIDGRPGRFEVVRVGYDVLPGATRACAYLRAL
jgi:hypothetical protein